MIQLGESLNRKKTIKCPSCGDRILYVLHDRKSGERLRFQDVRFLQSSKTTVRNPLYCSKCDSPWINKSTGRIIKEGLLTKKQLKNGMKTLKKLGAKPLDIDVISRTIIVGEKSNADDAFKYFKPMIKDCKASDIKHSELTGCKCSKDKARKAIPLKDGFYTDGKGSFISIENGIMIPCICPMPGTEVNFREIVQFQPITGPGIPEMLKAEKAKKRTGYKADTFIIDDVEPLTKKQIRVQKEFFKRLNILEPKR